MKKRMIISYILAFVLMLCSCDNRSETDSGVSSDKHTETVTDNTTDSVTEPTRVLSNEEMMKYGYDEDGYLTLEEAELEHLEDKGCVPIVGFYAGYDLDTLLDKFYLNDGKYYGRMILTGKVVSLRSHCRRTVIKYNDYDKDGNAAEMEGCEYSGYTETGFLVDGVLDINGSDLSGTPGYEELKAALVGKTVTLDQKPYWYIDDGGNQQKDIRVGHTYILKPGVRSVVICVSLHSAPEDTETTAEEQIDRINSSHFTIYDYYPDVDSDGNPIDSVERLRDYLSMYTQVSYPFMSPIQLQKHPKISISY